MDTQVITKLENAVGNTAYGKVLVDEAKKIMEEGPHKYAYTMKDDLDVRRGIIAGWIKRDERLGKTEHVPEEEEKLAIIAKALKALD